MLSRSSWKKLACASLLLVLGCSSVDSPAGPTPASPNPDLVGDLTGTVTRTVGGLLLQCTPQPYVKVSRLVGPSGGIINFGAHRLVVPPGALNRTLIITAEAMPEAG